MNSSTDERAEPERIPLPIECDLEEMEEMNEGIGAKLDRAIERRRAEREESALDPNESWA